MPHFFNPWRALVASLGLAAVLIGLPSSLCAAPRMQAKLNPFGQVVITENGKSVLQYNYRTVEPGDLLQKVTPDNLKYARARSDYIHPLYGFDGEELTADFPLDHPHHRGIYWAWPETSYGDEMGDLHALQRVFARPTGKLKFSGGSRYARVEAINLWRWEDRETIAEERTQLTVHPATPEGRFLDIVLTIKATRDGVRIARRGTQYYGGLNMRMNRVANQQILFHTDETGAEPRMAWGIIHGTFGTGTTPTSLVVFQHPANPHYPGDWVQYPELNWLQPTFPAANTRYELKPGNPLTLRYGLWVRPGPLPSEAECRAAWVRFVARHKVPSSTLRR